MSKIINFSEAASIAIHGLILIANTDETNINVQFIAEKLLASKHHVAKVMQRLVKAEYIVSQRGPSGGFRLLKVAKDINFLDVYEEIEGKLKVTSCPFEKGTEICSFQKCILNNVTAKMTYSFKEYMESQNVGMYIGNVKK